MDSWGKLPILTYIFSTGLVETTNWKISPRLKVKWLVVATSWVSPSAIHSQHLGPGRHRGEQGEQLGWNPTVGGRNPANLLRLVVYPIVYRVLYIPGGAGFLPSTVWRWWKVLSRCDFAFLKNNHGSGKEDLPKFWKETILLEGSMFFHWTMIMGGSGYKFIDG